MRTIAVGARLVWLESNRHAPVWILIVDFTGQLLATFPTVLYFFGLIARLIPHFAERGKPDIRSLIQSLDESFVFNLVIDSFTLSVIDGLILIFQFGTIASGFISLFTGVALCVLAFSFLRAHSLGGSVFTLLPLAVLFAADGLYYWFFGQRYTMGPLVLTDWQASLALPISVTIFVFIILMFLGRRLTKHGKQA